MTETKVEDVLIPLLKNLYCKARFNQIFKSVRINPKTLYLEGGFGFSINFIHVITSEDLYAIEKVLNDEHKFEPVHIENGKDSLDEILLNKGADLFERKIFKSKEEKIGIKMRNSTCNINKFSCRLFINIAKIQNNTKKNYHIISAILKSSDHNENSKLCNEQIINLVNGERNGHKSFFLLNNIPREVEDLLKKDTFVAIQLWNHRWESEKDNTFDAKTYVEENPYYFYSILTLDEQIFRRTYDNIMDVLGWCQSASSVKSTL